MSARVREARLGWLLVAPAFIVVVGMVGYPFVESIRISFTDKMIGRGPGEFVGLANYEYILGWPAFGEMVVRTVLFTIAAVIAKTVVGLILATASTRTSKAATSCAASSCCPGSCLPTSSFWRGAGFWMGRPAYSTRS
ncbi:MAG: hypothetical protein R2873_30665 [Caldilineaceae bacterium]